MLPRELSGTEDLLCPQLSCLTLCLGPSLAPSALTLSFSLPGKKEAFEVAEGKLIPYRGPSSLPVKTRFMQLIFTLIHLSTGSLPCTLPPFLFFLCQSLCIVFFSSPVCLILCESELGGHSLNYHLYFKDIWSLFQMDCSGSQY